MGLNVFKDYNSYSIRYKLTHPWILISNGFRNLKAAWQRATKGYCDRDTWNLDFWLLNVLPAALRHLAKTSYGWPRSDDFPEFKDWQNFLLTLADDFEECQDPEGTSKNEYDTDYMKQFDDWDNKWEKDKNGNFVYKEERTEIDEKYFARVKELLKEQQLLLENTFARMAKYLYGMWS